jgi:predicted ferric reductase
MVQVAIWRHVPLEKRARVFLQIGVSLSAAVTTVHWFLFAFRNVVVGKPFGTAVVRRLSNEDPSNPSLTDPSTILQVDIAVPRAWKVRAGQYIFLSIPKFGIFRGLRGHPFMISWWNRDQNGLTISLLVKSRMGFTAELDRNANKPLRAYIDGPYGARHDFSEYGTVIMFATGIGIAGHLLYIKDLITGYNSCLVKTKRILVIWQIQEECRCPKFWQVIPR